VNDFLSGALGPTFQDTGGSVAGRITMIDRSHALPSKRQAQELGISQGSVCYLPRPVSPADLAIMRRIDGLYLEFPFAGSRMLRDKIACRMDAPGTWRDNFIVERLWRSVKYEEVYLRAYGGVSEARASIARYLGFYKGKRPHSSLAAKTPDQAYFDNLLVKMAACSWRPTCYVTPVGLRPPCMTRRIGISRNQLADDPLILCRSLCRPTEPP